MCGAGSGPLRQPVATAKGDARPDESLQRLRAERAVGDGTERLFSTHDNSNYTLVVIEGIESEGHTIKISPLLGYAVADNMVVGGKFGYSRTFLRLDGGGFSMGGGDTGIELKVDSYYALKHLYEGSLFWRQYIPFGDNKRFALFSEVQLILGGSQAKFAADTPVRGTYETGLRAPSA